MKVFLVALVSVLFVFSVMPTVFAGSNDKWVVCGSSSYPANSIYTLTQGSSAGTTYVCCSISGSYQWYQANTCPTSTSNATFASSQLPSSFTWSVTLSGQGTKSAAGGSSIIFTGLASNSYTWSTPTSISCGTGCQYVPNYGSGVFSVPPNFQTTLTYTKQYQICMAVSPSGSGTTSPTAGSCYWENAGSSVSISATASTGYTFSQWSSSTGSITIANSASSSTTATVNGYGTVTATFTSSTCPTGSVCATGSCVLPSGYSCGTGTQSVTLCSSTNACTVAGTPQSCSVGCPSGYTCSSGQCISSSFDFSISSTPASGSVVQGSSTTSTIAVGLLSGTTQSVSLSVSGCPTGTTCTVSPTSGNPTYTSTLTMTAGTSTPTGTYSIVTTGTGGGQTHTTTYSLTINPQTTVTISPSFNLVPNQLATVTVTFYSSALDFTMQQSHNVNISLVIDPGTSQQYWINCFNAPITLMNSNMQSQTVSCPSYSGTCTATTSNGYAQIAATCSVPSTVTAGTHTLQATPTIFSQAITLPPGTTVMTVFYSSVNDWVNSVTQAIMSIFTSFASALKVV